MPPKKRGRKPLSEDEKNEKLTSTECGYLFTPESPFINNHQKNSRAPPERYTVGTWLKFWIYVCNGIPLSGAAKLLNIKCKTKAAWVDSVLNAVYAHEQRPPDDNTGSTIACADETYFPRHKYDTAGGSRGFCACFLTITEIDERDGSIRRTRWIPVPIRERATLQEHLKKYVANSQRAVILSDTWKGCSDLDVLVQQVNGSRKKEGFITHTRTQSTLKVHKAVKQHMRRIFYRWGETCSTTAIQQGVALGTLFYNHKTWHERLRALLIAMKKCAYSPERPVPADRLAKDDDGLPKMRLAFTKYGYLRGLTHINLRWDRVAAQDAEIRRLESISSEELSRYVRQQVVRAMVVQKRRYCYFVGIVQKENRLAVHRYIRQHEHLIGSTYMVRNTDPDDPRQFVPVVMIHDRTQLPEGTHNRLPGVNIEDTGMSFFDDEGGRVGEDADADDYEEDDDDDET